MTSGEPKRALISGVTGQDGAYVAREGGSHHRVPAFRHPPEPGCLAGLVEARREPVMRSDALGSAEPSRVINTGAAGELHHRTDPGSRQHGDEQEEHATRDD